MRLLSNNIYISDVKTAAQCGINWDKLRDSSIVISGATGLIGSFLIDTIMYRNSNYGLNCKVYALGRSVSKAENRFSEYLENDSFEFVQCDICKPETIAIDDDIDYVFHAASNTHPVAYASDPIGTITVNVIGLQSLLEFARLHNAKRLLFA